MNSETALLQAVRDQIRERCGYKDYECECEYDEMAPATTGDIYIAVLPGGWQPGPVNDLGGGVLDEILGVEVCVVKRATSKPRDRKRGLFLENLEGLNERIFSILAQQHFCVEVKARADALIDSTEMFIEMLKWAGCDQRPRAVGSEFFAARSGENSAGLARSVYFRGATRTQRVSSIR